MLRSSWLACELGVWQGRRARDVRKALRTPGAPGRARRSQLRPGLRKPPSPTPPTGLRPPQVPSRARHSPARDGSAPRGSQGSPYPGNGERLLEVLAPHEAEAPGSRALQDYLLGGHGAATAGGDPRGQTGQDAERRAGLPGSCRRKSARRGLVEPAAGGSWAGGGRGRLRPGRVAAARPSRPPARGPQPPPAPRARTLPGQRVLWSLEPRVSSGSRDLNSPAPGAAQPSSQPHRGR